MKTQKQTGSVPEFIQKITDEQMRSDCQELDKLFQKISGGAGVLWGTSIVGYGSYSYTRSNGKSYNFLSLGFSPRAKNITIYSLPGYNLDEETLQTLGTCSAGKSCLYIKRLSDVNLNILEKLLQKNFNEINGTHIDYKELRAQR